jgi:photosystem II stability/assembly factor-like uncharacterized protein
MLGSRTFAFVVFLFLPLFTNAQDGPAVADAPLRAVTMVDAKEGWAVGEDGLILHTLDGWETCERQTTHVRASLRCVQFIDPYIGYACGLEVLPFGRGTVGVVLGTTDGGSSWNKLVNRELPGLNAIRFVDADVGFAFGDTTGGCASGVFMTVNRGRTWTTVPTLTATTGWACGTIFQDLPLFAGAGGHVGTLSSKKDQVIVLSNRVPKDVQLQAMAAMDQDVWAVGTQATLLVSRKTDGKSWDPVTLPLPETLRASLDFNTVCCQGEHIWIAGRPGSLVFHSWDRGKSWEAQRTGQSFPLNSLCFTDESNGWAVGECGTVVQTKDGGRSWAVRRRGGHRAGLLVVTAQAANAQAPSAYQLPLGTLAVLGGDQGYLTTAVQVTHRPEEYRSNSDRLRQAIRTVGAGSADVLSGFVLADYQDAMPAEKMQQVLDPKRLEEQLVLALRTWRPSVVVCDALASNGSNGIPSQVVGVALRKACELSGKADAYPEHFSKFDLRPWQPARLFGRAAGDAKRDTMVDLDLPRPVLFASANDFANLARPLVLDRFPPAPAKEEFMLVQSWVEPADIRTDLMAGLTLGHGGQARREKVEVDDVRYPLLVEATKKQWFETMEPRAKMNDPAEARQFFTHFQKSLLGLAPTTVGDRIFAKAQEFADQGNWMMARECHLMLLDHLPNHRLAPEACRFIMTTMGSSEARRRADLGQMKTLSEYPLAMPRLKMPDREGKFDPDQQLKASRTIIQRRAKEFRVWHEGALAASEVYSMLEPLAYLDPSTQFCRQANRRLVGQHEGSLIWQTTFQSTSPPSPWLDAAASEAWLAVAGDGPGPWFSPPKRVLQARRITSMPTLDGKLDDAVWKDVPTTALQPCAGATAAKTEVRMAFDDQHLYLAVRCQTAGGMPKAPAFDKPRKRDEDLRMFDRVSLMLDLDRDYNSYFHFEFDQRGCVAEDCCGDRTWNPRWFVHVHPTTDGWTAEVAIPLGELTGKVKLTGEVWACNITRITPGVGLQAASLPAAAKPRCEGMALLNFEFAELKQAAGK